MTIEQVEKRINHLCENEPDNIAGIRYWVGYRDALVSVKPMIDELNYNHDRLHDWDRGMTEKLEAAIAGQETLQKELARYKEMYKDAAAERDANMKRVIELGRKVGV